MTEGRSGLEPRLLEIIRCPGCGERLIESSTELTCQGCSKRFPIRDGIPVLLLDEAL